MSEEAGPGSEEILKLSSFVIFFLLALYTIAAAYIEAKGSAFLHETSVAIFFGMFIAGSAILFGMHEFNEKVRFSDDVFFYVILPPIVFSAGYNMKRRKFFQHFNYIALFGIAGTFACFVFFALLTWVAFELFPITKWAPELHEWVAFKPSLEEILLLSSLMCSSDVVAAVSIIKFEE